MKLISTIVVILFFNQGLTAQSISGSELLAKTIKYHDPDGNWANLNAKLTFAQESATRGKYSRVVEFNNGQDSFSFVQKDDEKEIEFNLSKDECKIKLNGRTEFSNEDAEKYRLSCDRVRMYRNYYVYLYGLPMKLTDKGSVVNKVVVKQDFQGTEYYVLNVDYEESVGTDSWYFYINTTTFAMEGYRFYQNGRKDNGEYITLEGIQEINGIKIPKVRKWYTNMEDKLLGTDDLILVEDLD